VKDELVEVVNERGKVGATDDDDDDPITSSGLSLTRSIDSSSSDGYAEGPEEGPEENVVGEKQRPPPGRSIKGDDEIWASAIPTENARFLRVVPISTWGEPAPANICISSSASDPYPTPMGLLGRVLME
jgi:hypothetical protein